MAESDREHDVVVFGATGFVGALTAKYLAKSAPEHAKIALGGRSEAKLEETRASLPARAADWPLIVADSSDATALAAMAASAKVVATTVGPYDRYGLPLVKACAAAGTHYADLTGEVLFMRKSIDAADADAKASGARIVHTCGFDSIPSDIGVFLLSELVKEDGAGELSETTLVVKGMRGGASGGTIDSMRGMIDTAKSDKLARKIALDPYGLSPDRAAEPSNGSERDPAKVSRDESLGGWLAPFVMGMVNSRVVRRSNALSGYSYGRSLRYRELMLGGNGPAGLAKAWAITGGLAALFGGMSLPPTRKLLDRFLPDPGEGPSEAARDKGYYKIEIHATTTTGARYVCAIEASGDPGYKATAVLLGESALTLSLDEARCPDASGVLTPATAMGQTLLGRLRAAGHSYDARAVR